jgi:hypothetical protein
MDLHLAAVQTTENYKQLVELATELGMEYEQERLTRNWEEAEQDINDTFDAMCDAGVTPEMFEAYVS